ncbi:MAG: hypothetical protein U0350_19900 [Caldilineaceae bacterium]
MKRIFYLYMMLGICFFILVGCAPVAPGVEPSSPYVIGPSGVIAASTSYTLGQRDSACIPITPFNTVRASDLYPKEEPILWTFGINFNELSPAGNPLGCLRLYQRNPLEGGEFVAVDKGGVLEGGILVDTCQIVKRSAPVSVTKGIATFTGGGYIQCEMDLREWVKKLEVPLSASSVLTSELESFVITSTHKYTNFTMVAALSINSIGSKLVSPIMHYEPSEGNPVDFSVNFANGVVTAPVNKCVEGVPPGYPLNRMGLWWYDLQIDRGYPLQYHAHTTNGLPRVEMTCNALPEDAPPVPIPFSIGPATLYIGYDPTKDEPIGASAFDGSMKGVLIDPSDSKPTE